MKTKEQVIDEMCMTWRHDFGLDWAEEDFTSGMTEPQRDALRNEMRKLIEHHGHDIARLCVMV